MIYTAVRQGEKTASVWDSFMKLARNNVTLMRLLHARGRRYRSDGLVPPYLCIPRLPGLDLHCSLIVYLWGQTCCPWVTDCPPDPTSPTHRLYIKKWTNYAWPFALKMCDKIWRHYHVLKMTIKWLSESVSTQRGEHKNRRITILAMCLNAESDDLNILSTPDTSPFLVTLMLSQGFPRLHENFAIVPADKASNNYTFVCKRYYVGILIEELGLHLLPGNPTYNLTDFFPYIY